MKAPDLATLKVMVLKAGRSAQPSKPVVVAPGGVVATPLDTVEPSDNQKVQPIVADPNDAAAAQEGSAPPDWQRSPDRVARLLRAKRGYQRRGMTHLTGEPWEDWTD